MYVEFIRYLTFSRLVPHKTNVHSLGMNFIHSIAMSIAMPVTMSIARSEHASHLRHGSVLIRGIAAKKGRRLGTCLLQGCFTQGAVTLRGNGLGLDLGILRQHLWVSFLCWKEREKIGLCEIRGGKRSWLGRSDGALVVLTALVEALPWPSNMIQPSDSMHAFTPLLLFPLPLPFPGSALTNTWPIAITARRRIVVRIVPLLHCERLYECELIRKINNIGSVRTDNTDINRNPGGWEGSRSV